MSTAALPGRRTDAAVRATRWVRVAAIVAVVALALWIGGLVALGAFAAPLVFGRVPAPWSGDAMGAVFRRFDALAMTSAVIVLACEALRLWAAPIARSGPPSVRDRARGLFAIVASLAAIYSGAAVSPKIVALHAAGAVRGVAEAGIELERLHRIAETMGKIEITFGLLLLILQIVTLDSSKDESAHETP